MLLQVLSRDGCGLCNEAVSLLAELGETFETVDIDEFPALLASYGDHIPVVLLGGREISRAPLTREGLRSALHRIRGSIDSAR